MIYILLSILLVVAMVFIIRSSFYEHYDKLMFGTIVGKYKGASDGGYVVVEIKYKVKASDSWLPPISQTKSGTFEVPSDYFNNCQIGDKGVFPFKIEGDLVNQ